MAQISIFEDALARPDLFLWFGIDSHEFKEWLQALPLRVHPGLVGFWDRTGGGDVFESETLLGPLHPDVSENALKVNEPLWADGMSHDLMIFHIGSFRSASHYTKNNHWVVTLKQDSYEIDRRFRTFNDWYTETIRAEFAQRYSLQSQKLAMRDFK